MNVRRSQCAWAVAALVGVLLMTACGPGTDSGEGSGTGKHAKTKPGPGPSAPPRIPSTAGLPGVSHTVVFAADGSGFTLRAECTRTRCRQHVAVLDAGAGEWRRATSPLPDITGDLGITAGLTVLGPDRALIEEGRAFHGGPDRTWFTGDGGRTWKSGTTQPTGITATVPKGAALAEECVETDPADLNSCLRNRLLVVMPDTGERRVLDGRPPLKGLVHPAGDLALLPGGSDTLFVAGEAPDSGLPTLALSEDRGRTWRTTRMPGAARDGWNPWVVAGGGELYAVQSGQLPSHEGVKNGLLAIHASTDGGDTWTRIWRYRKGVEPLSVLSLLAAADGSLTVHGESGAWLSADQARTFHRVVRSRGPAGSVTQTPIGWLWCDSFGSGHCRISADGIRWQDFHIGEDQN